MTNSICFILRARLDRSEQSADHYFGKLSVLIIEAHTEGRIVSLNFVLLQEETMKEKLQRAMNYKRAGLPVPADIPLFRERPSGQHIEQDPMDEEPELVKESVLKKGNHLSTVSIQVNGASSMEERNGSASSKELSNLDCPVASKSLKRKKFTVGIDLDTVEDINQRFAANNPADVDRTQHVGLSDTKSHGDRDEKLRKKDNGLSKSSLASNGVVEPLLEVDSVEHGNPEKKSRKNDTPDNAAPIPDIEMSAAVESNGAASNVNDTQSQEILKSKKKKKKKKRGKVAEEARLVEDVDREVAPVTETDDVDEVAVPAVQIEDVLPSLRPQDIYLKEALDTQSVTADLKLRKVVVPISRPDDVVKGRENLPIVMMEQEIIEAISENDVVIVCGETGCGKTTQVPQVSYTISTSLNLARLFWDGFV